MFTARALELFHSQPPLNSGADFKADSAGQARPSGAPDEHRARAAI